MRITGGVHRFTGHALVGQPCLTGTAKGSTAPCDSTTGTGSPPICSLFEQCPLRSGECHERDRIRSAPEQTPYFWPGAGWLTDSSERMSSVNGSFGAPAVRLTLPSELSGGNLHQLFGHMGLRAEQGSASDEWVVSDNAVRPHRSTQTLVRSDYLAGPGLKSERFDLMVAPGQDEFMQHLDPERLVDEMAQIARFGGRDSIAAMLYACQVEVLSASDKGLAKVVQDWHTRLSEGVFSDDPSRQVFPNASTHWVSINPILYWRAWLPAMVMRVAHDPSFVAELRTKSLERGGGLTFASNHALAGSSFLHGNYLGPLLACLSPHVWSVHGPRLMNSVIFNLGRAVPGQAPIPLDALDLLPCRIDGFTPAARSDIELEARTSWREAIDWWAMRLDQLFTFVGDPASYRDAAGFYQPYRHQNWLINTAELFDRVTSALRSSRDHYASIILTFSALDLVSEQFLGSDTGAVADPVSAGETLDEVRQAMPTQVAKILLPGAERAVEALRCVAEGFFLNTSTVEYTGKNGVTRKTPLEAVGPLIRARRNAVHGFGGTQAVSKGSHELLAQHQGNLPADLAFLPYLCLLKVLCNLDKLEARIEKGVRVAA